MSDVSVKISDSFFPYLQYNHDHKFSFFSELIEQMVVLLKKEDNGAWGEIVNNLNISLNFEPENRTLSNGAVVLLHEKTLIQLLEATPEDAVKLFKNIVTDAVNISIAGETNASVPSTQVEVVDDQYIWKALDDTFDFEKESEMYARMRNQQARHAATFPLFPQAATHNLSDTPTPFDELSKVLEDVPGRSLIDVADAVATAVSNAEIFRVAQSRYRERIALVEMVDLMVKNASPEELEVRNDKNETDLREDVKITVAKHMAAKLPTKQTIQALVDALSHFGLRQHRKERPFADLIVLQKSFEIARDAMTTHTISDRYFWEALRPMLAQDLSVDTKDDLLASLRDWMRQANKTPSKYDAHSFACHSPYILNELVKDGSIDLATPNCVRTEKTVDPSEKWNHYFDWAKAFGNEVNMFDALGRGFNDEHEQRAAQELLAKIAPTASSKSKSKIK